LAPQGHMMSDSGIIMSHGDEYDGVSFPKLTIAFASSSSNLLGKQ